MRAQPFAQAYFFSRYNENHDPDNGQFTSGSGGGSGGSVEPGEIKAAKPVSAEKPVGYEFVSPSVADHLDFSEAVSAISGDQQQQLREASLYINGALGVHAKEYDIVGAWADGAENSVMDIIDRSDWERLVLGGSMKGYIADQKQVLVFQEQEHGSSILYNFEASGKLAEIHANLLKDGLAFHTLIPHKGGATVYVVDLDGSAHDAVAKGAERYDSDVEARWGRAEFLGTQKQDGSDREQRDDARRAYEENIGKSPVQNSQTIWQRVRDRWGQAEQVSDEPKVIHRDYLPHSETAEPKYIRFGDIPESGKSTVGAAPSALWALASAYAGEGGVGSELAGVSVFKVEYDKARNLWSFDNSELAESGYASLDELLASQDEYVEEFVGGGHKHDPETGKHLGWTPPVYEWKKVPAEDIRPIYLVTGKDTNDLGTDDEPLIEDVKILDTLKIQDVFHDGYFDPDEDLHPTNNPSAFGVTHEQALAAYYEKYPHLDPNKPPDKTGDSRNSSQGPLRNERPFRFQRTPWSPREACLSDLFSRYNENHDPDTGQFTGPGGDSGGGVAPTPLAAPAPVSKGPKIANVVKMPTPKTETVSIATPTTSQRITDFEKEITLGPFKNDKARADQFFADWDKRIGLTPEAFKASFYGGAEVSVAIIVHSNGVWEFRGYVKQDGHEIGEHQRFINWQAKTGNLAFLKLYHSATGKGVAKKILAGGIAALQKYGITRDIIHANIDVGGYAWAKYGYVPNGLSWSALSASISRRIGGSGRSPSSGETYTPDSWEEIGNDDQEEIKRHWIDDTRQEFIESEVNNWRENGDALDDAKYQLARNFDGSEDWAVDAVSEIIDSHREGDTPVPYTSTQILNAISAEEYETGYEGRKDPAFSFDDAKLREPSNAPPPGQMTLPGIEEADLAAHLTDDVRDEITDALTKAFNDKAESDAEDLEPPGYLADNVGEYQDEYWDSMRERDRYEWARINGYLPEIEIEPDDEDEPDKEPVDVDPNSDLRALVSNSNPKAIWAIADSPRGKELLLGTDWEGALDLRDKASMDRFNAYIGKDKDKKYGVAA